MIVLTEMAFRKKPPDTSLRQSGGVDYQLNLNVNKINTSKCRNQHSKWVVLYILEKNRTNHWSLLGVMYTKSRDYMVCLTVNLQQSFLPDRPQENNYCPARQLPTGHWNRLKCGPAPPIAIIMDMKYIPWAICIACIYIYI